MTESGGPTHILADQLTISVPGRAILPIPLLSPPPFSDQPPSLDSYCLFWIPIPSASIMDDPFHKKNIILFMTFK